MIVIDVEVYKDYFLLSALQLSSGKVVDYEMFPGQPAPTRKIATLMNNHTTVSFNGFAYDLLILCAVLEGYDCAELKKLSDLIVTTDKPSWAIAHDAHLDHTWNHIDLIEVAPGSASLKVYGGRVGAPKMQDLPIDPAASISPEQRAELRKYCRNDLDVTARLYRQLEKQIELRSKMTRQYGMDLRSKSDAQIAETVIKSELTSKYGFEFQGRHVKKKGNFNSDELAANQAAKDYSARGYSYTDAHMMAANDFGLCPSRLGSVRAQLKKRRKTSMDKNADAQMSKSFRYTDPGVISFQTPDLQSVFDRILKTDFELGKNGSVLMPQWLKDERVMVADRQYQMGIGGLHSCEKGQSVIPGSSYFLADWDVASYYPSIILQQGLYPEHLGRDFLTIYESIVNRRLEAKRTGDKVTADSLKITINGSFGKFGSKYSALYSPNLLIQTTITGQLALLMLIERMASIGVDTVSANTDGVVLYGPCSLESEVGRVAWDWMLDTSYTLERTDYSAMTSRDVNNYLAVKLDGSIKGKGCFADPGLMKNPENQIVYEAVKDNVAKGTPIEQTIRGCHDVLKFLTVRKVTGGAVWNDESVGKTVRFYYSNAVPSDRCILYKKNGNRVPKSAGSKPLMNLPDNLPDDIDYPVYIEAAEKLLCEVGYA